MRGSRHEPIREATGAESDLTTCVEIDVSGETVLSVRGLDRWKSVRQGARVVERLQQWGETGDIFRVETADGEIKHYILFGLTRQDEDPASSAD